MFLALALWLTLSFVLPVSVGALDRVTLAIIDLPLGTVLSTHGVLLLLVIGAFWFARRQDRIDRDHFVDGGGA